MDMDFKLEFNSEFPTDANLGDCQNSADSEQNSDSNASNLKSEQLDNPDTRGIKTDPDTQSMTLISRNANPNMHTTSPDKNAANSEKPNTRPDTRNSGQHRVKQEVDPLGTDGTISVKEEFCDDPVPLPEPVLTKRRRTVLSLADKAELLRRLHEGASQKQLAQEYGIGTSTVSDLKKHEAEILGYVAANEEEASSRSKLEANTRTEVEEAVLSWLKQEAGNGREVTGQQVQARARQEHQRLRGDQQYLASTGSLDRFRRRYNLRPPRVRRGRRRGRQTYRESSPTEGFSNCEGAEDDDCEGQVCPEAVQPLVSVEEGHVSVQLPPVQDVPSAAEAATLLSRALVWAAAQQDTTPQQLFVIKQLQTRAALRGIMKDGL